MVGRYVLHGSIMGILENTPRGANGEWLLTDGIAELLTQQRVLGVSFSGKRFDCGNKVGFLEANLHFGLRFLR